MSLLENLNKLNKNISEEAVEQNNILDAIKEFKKVIGAKGSDDNTLDELIAEIAEELPEKIGGGSGGITVDESYDISEGTLNGATYTIESGVTAHIPDGVTSIGDYAFDTCTSLTSIVIPDSVTSIGERAFSSCNALTTLTIPNSVTSIGDNAFTYCYVLKSLTIGNSVTSIGDHAFYSCWALTTLTIPDSVTSISNYAFCGCYALTTLTIPDSVTSIGDNAFSDCRALKTIDMTAFDGTTVPTLANSYAFDADTHARGFKFLFATQEALNAFASAPKWSTYSRYFKVQA